MKSKGNRYGTILQIRKMALSLRMEIIRMEVILMMSGMDELRHRSILKTLEMWITVLLISGTQDIVKA